ncbi:MAG: pyruvate, phosphate dikinase, partial [Armatimonadetes bacterium]|nr:pyruvate, phosphate dikinase [Armatimonadota bacterium]
LNKLLPFQKEDFKGILGAMEGYPVTIRLLDPPLHEFLPQLDELLVAETKLELENRQPGSFSPKELFDLLETREVLEFLKMDQLLSLAGGTYGAILQEMKKLPLHELIPQEMTPERKEAVSSLFRYKEFVSWLLDTKEKVLERVRQLHEFNPMLGLRVCRLGIVFPEIYQMQVQAVFEAACELVSEGVRVFPEVMIPGVGHVNEMKFTRKLSQTVAERTMAQQGLSVAYKIGTMIELPRACVVADQLAHFAEFFSFGTNDLTQTVYGYSRDDAEKSFVPEYRRKEILEHNPFEILDTEGVGELMEMAIKKGRGVNPELKVGICGEHGGEPSSVHFCHKVGLNYVSCSPYRVPIARLAAAHVALADTGYTTA